MLTHASRLNDFPSMRDMVYLNTAAEGIPPKVVEEALLQYIVDKRLGMDGRDRHFAHLESAKREAAALLELTPQEIGFCSCSSEAFNHAAAALRLSSDDEVIINDLDFPAGCTPWLHPDCLATVKLWRSRDGMLRIEDLIPLLGPQTRLVSTSLVSFLNGYMIPLEEVVAAVRQHSPALIVLDVTQALGRMPLDLSGVDLIISSTHKWLLGSHGGCIVGVPERCADEWTVPAGGWFNLDDPFGPQRFKTVTAKSGAASFSVGMPNFAAIYALRAAIAYLRTIGIETIHQHAQPLVHNCLAALKKMPVELITPEDPASLAGIIAFRHPDAEKIHRCLHERNIHVMCSAGRLRVAIHGYNTAADVDRFLATLRESLT